MKNVCVRELVWWGGQTQWSRTASSRRYLSCSRNRTATSPCCPADDPWHAGRLPAASLLNNSTSKLDEGSYFQFPTLTLKIATGLFYLLGSYFGAVYKREPSFGNHLVADMEAALGQGKTRPGGAGGRGRGLTSAVDVSVWPRPHGPFRSYVSVRVASSFAVLTLCSWLLAARVPAVGAGL